MLLFSQLNRFLPSIDYDGEESNQNLDTMTVWLDKSGYRNRPAKVGFIAKENAYENEEMSCIHTGSIDH